MWNCFLMSYHRDPVFATSNFCHNLRHSGKGTVLGTPAFLKHKYHRLSRCGSKHSFCLCYIPSAPCACVSAAEAVGSAPNASSIVQVPVLLSCSASQLLPRQLESLGSVGELTVPGARCRSSWITLLAFLVYFLFWFLIVCFHIWSFWLDLKIYTGLCSKGVEYQAMASGLDSVVDRECCGLV